MKIFKVKILLIVLLSLTVSWPVYAQFTGNYGGLTLRTTGYGAKYLHLNGKEGMKTRTLFSTDVLIHKHPKEHRIYNPEIQNSSTYVFGKLNRVALLRLNGGINRLIVPRNEWSRIGMSYNISAGPQLVGLKPVYLNIYYPGQNASPGIINPERYDPDVHVSQSNIVGYSEARYGWDELKFKYGLQLSSSIQLSWGNSGTGIKVFQIGAGLDAYPGGLTIMADTENPKLYGTLFASFLWGVDGK